MNVKLPLKASNKPIIWSLFAAGGTVTALLFPALILLFALAVPFGLLPAELFSYDRIQGMLDNTFIKLIVFALLFLSIWHAAHRMRITAHDFGIRADGFIAFLFYSIALLATILLVIALF
ncbi:MAG: fumarate reductase subunit D [Gammaproteobacteria bacterium]|nr:fumarate reductase subunit D [Gammaproteobacteria bacterium]